MITSPDNEKLKLVRKLRQKKHRQKAGLFVTEGEDLLNAGLAAGREPKAVLVHPDSGIEGEEVEPELLDRVSELGSGTRVIGIWHDIWAEPELITAAKCIFLDGLSNPGNVGTIIRTVDALIDATVVLGPNCADPFSSGAVRASMGSIFSQPVRRGDIQSTPEPRIAMVAHGGEWPGPDGWSGDSLPRIRARRSFGRSIEGLRKEMDDRPAAGRGRVPECRRRGCDRLRTDIFAAAGATADRMAAE